MVSTNALELGIDIGALDACVLCGYPGTIASALGSRPGAPDGARAPALCPFWWLPPPPLDQYVVEHPDYFFRTSARKTRWCSPDNLYILHSATSSAPLTSCPSEDGRCLRRRLPRHGETAGISGGRTTFCVIVDGQLSLDGRRISSASEISLRSAASGELRHHRHHRPGPSPGHRRNGPLSPCPCCCTKTPFTCTRPSSIRWKSWTSTPARPSSAPVDVGYYTDADMNVSLQPAGQLEQQKD